MHLPLFVHKIASLLELSWLIVTSLGAWVLNSTHESCVMELNAAAHCVQEVLIPNERVGQAVACL